MPRDNRIEWGSKPATNVIKGVAYRSGRLIHRIGKGIKISSPNPSDIDETDEVFTLHNVANTASGGGENSGKLIRNRLYNLIVSLEIPAVPTFSVRAILDTGATTCCIDEKSIPAAALEDNTFSVQFTGVNSKQTTNKKLRYGCMTIGDNVFNISYTYAFPMHLRRRHHLLQERHHNPNATNCKNISVCRGN
ncbi:hypothetical protein EJ110_NYTH34855 [Nymphaea thermarum]|nr:hypothetical protein EJ110_NYTH34855 [Nymphaea thermarum]